jgi:hypothetical protein
VRQAQHGQHQCISREYRLQEQGFLVRSYLLSSFQIARVHFDDGFRQGRDPAEVNSLLVIREIIYKTCLTLIGQSI